MLVYCHASTFLVLILFQSCVVALTVAQSTLSLLVIRSDLPAMVAVYDCPLIYSIKYLAPVTGYAQKAMLASCHTANSHSEIASL